MPRVNLNTILFYRGDEETHAPTEEEYPLTGVDQLFLNVRFPRSGTTFLYGHRNPGIQYFLQHGARLGMDRAVLDIPVEIEKWHRQKLDFSDNPECGLQYTRFMSIARCKREIIDRIERIFMRTVEPSRLAEDNWPKEGTSFPYLFDEVIKEKEFKHLAAIAYTVKTVEVGDVQVATVFDTDAIVGVSGGPLLDGVGFTL